MIRQQFARRTRVSCEHSSFEGKAFQVQSTDQTHKAVLSRTWVQLESSEQRGREASYVMLGSWSSLDRQPGARGKFKRSVWQ